MSLVTFGFEDIEFIRPDNGFDRIKTVIWRDRDFQAWVREVGTEQALVEVTVFHRHVANQLISTATKDPDSSDWAARAIALCARLKGRRAGLRQRYAVESGWTALGVLVDRLKAEHPRAEWGTANRSTDHGNGSQ